MPVAAQVVARLEARPDAQVALQLVVAHGDLLQFGPAVDVAFDEAGRLNRLRDAVVVEVSEPRVPAPAASREAELFAALDEWRDALLHQLDLARVDPDEMTLFERVLVGDVADVDVEQPIAVDVAEVN